MHPEALFWVLRLIFLSLSLGRITKIIGETFVELIYTNAERICNLAEKPGSWTHDSSFHIFKLNN